MEKVVGTDRVKQGMAQMQKGGVIMDVINAEQAKIAEEAVLWRSWHWNGCLLIFVQLAVWREWQTQL